MFARDLAATFACDPSVGARTAALRSPGLGELGLLAEGERRAALRAAVVAGALAEVVFARECGMVAGLAAPLLLELDGLLALQWRILGAMVDNGCIWKLSPATR